MNHASSSQVRHRPLAGLRAWIITDGKMGMDVQARGLAQTLGLDYEMKHVDPRGIWKFAAPWGPADPKAMHRPCRQQTVRAAVAGRLHRHRPLEHPVSSVPSGARRARGPIASCCRTRRPAPKTADLIWVPAHDRRRGTNVITTLDRAARLSVPRCSPNVCARQVPAGDRGPAASPRSPSSSAARTASTASPRPTTTASRPRSPHWAPTVRAS